MQRLQTKTRNIDKSLQDIPAERYATVCLSLNPSELPAPLLKRLVSMSASKIGSRDVKLASHVIIILNVSFNKRAGHLTPDVLLLKNPNVLAEASSAGGGESKR